MYNTPYYGNYNPQASIDRINNQIAELEKMKAQIPTPNTPAINQTFQLAPTNHNGMKYANSIDEVQKDIVIGDTPYFSNDLSVVWIKNTKGDIKSYELKEIVKKDEKDIQIELLQSQLDELRKEIKKYDEHITNDIESKTTTDTQWYDESTGKPIKEDKSTSIQRISKSKTK